jgi:hypothetical protein
MNPSYRHFLGAVVLLFLLMPAGASAQTGQVNQALMDDAVTLFGYDPGRLTREQRGALTEARRQLLPNMDRGYRLNLTQAIAIAYIGLVMRETPRTPAPPAPLPLPVRRCEAMAMLVYELDDFDWTQTDAIQLGLASVRREAARCGCNAVADAAAFLHQGFYTPQRWEEQRARIKAALRACP